MTSLFVCIERIKCCVTCIVGLYTADIRKIIIMIYLLFDVVHTWKVPPPELANRITRDEGIMYFTKHACRHRSRDYSTNCWFFGYVMIVLDISICACVSNPMLCCMYRWLLYLGPTFYRLHMLPTCSVLEYGCLGWPSTPRYKFPHTRRVAPGCRLWSSFSGRRNRKHAVSLFFWKSKTSHRSLLTTVVPCVFPMP